MEILRNIALKGAQNKSISADVYFTLNSFYKPIVVFNHGFKGFKDWGIWDMVAKSFANEGFAFVKFNQSHNGIKIKKPLEFTDLDSFGRNTYSNELTDIEAVTEWICNNPSIPLDLVNKDKLYLLGHSRGGSTSILAASKSDRVKRVASWAAFKDIGERFRTPAYTAWENEKTCYIENSRTGQKMPQEYSIFEDYQANRDAFDIEAACKALSIPQLIVHGTEDPTVLFNDALTLRGWNQSSELFLVPNADHVFGGTHPYEEEELPLYAQRAVTETIRFFNS